MSKKKSKYEIAFEKHAVPMHMEDAMQKIQKKMDEYRLENRIRQARSRMAQSKIVLNC
jgi:hypothetical protein